MLKYNSLSSPIGDLFDVNVMFLRCLKLRDSRRIAPAY